MAARCVGYHFVLSGSLPSLPTRRSSDLRVWSADDTLVLQPLGMISEPDPAALRDQIAAALPPASTTMKAVCRLDTGIGHAFAEVAARAAEELTGGGAELVEIGRAHV